MSQTPKQTLIESVASTAFSFVKNLALTYLLLKAFGVPVSLSQNFYVTVAMTIQSVFCAYYLRRFWNWRFSNE
jgi:hypothetical protein